MRWSAIAVSALFTLALVGCSKKNPTQPAGMDLSSARTGVTATTGAARQAPGRPEYEPAYEDGGVVTINAIEVPGRAPEQAQADLFVVVYPPNWQALGIAPPQCNPCDHAGDGVDPGDFHDHVLDTAPGDVGYKVPWHVYVVAPAYNGDPTHDAAIGALYKANLPLKSEAAVNEFVAKRLPSGAPVAALVDANFYFLCAVVPAQAMP